MQVRISEENLNLSQNAEVYSRIYDQHLDVVVKVSKYVVDIEATTFGNIEKVVFVDWNLYTPLGKWVNRYEFSSNLGYLQEVAEYLAVTDAGVAFSYLTEVPEHDFVSDSLAA